MVAVRPRAEIPWLQPFPDRLLEPAAPSDEGPDAAAVAKETIEWLHGRDPAPAAPAAGGADLQDVLGWSAKETAALLDTSVASVKSSRALGYDVGFPGPLDSPTLFGMAGSGGTAAYADTAIRVAVAVTKNRVTYGEINAFNQVGDAVTKALDGR